MEAPVEALVWVKQPEPWADGVVALGCTDGTLRLWNVAAATCSEGWQAHAGGVFAVAWSGLREQLFSAGADGEIKVWAGDSRALLRSLQGHSDAVLCLEWDDPQAMLASGSADGTVRLWVPENAFSSVALGAEGGPGITCMAFGPRGMVAGGSIDGSVRIWNVLTHTEMFSSAHSRLGGTPGHSKAVTGITWVNDGGGLVTGAMDQSLCLWNAVAALSWANTLVVLARPAMASDEMRDAREAMVAELAMLDQSVSTQLWDGLDESVLCVSCSPDGTLIAAASEDAHAPVALWPTADLPVPVLP